MNKLSIVTLITCTVSMSSAMAIGSSGNSNHNNGTINFIGYVYSNSCQIVTEDRNKFVRLEAVKNTDINKSDYEQETNFTISVSGCNIIQDMITPKLSWDKVNNPSREGYLTNTNKTGPKNVALLLKDSGGKRINLNNEENRFAPERYVKGDDPKFIYKFSVGYILTDDKPVTPGPVTALIKYSINYF
mgnify:CR=1 FL=1